MTGHTELRPIPGGCRHLRGLYKLEKRGRSPFPERELIRYECERAFEIESEEDIENCMAARIDCWQKKT